MKQLVEYIVSNLVNHPEDVVIEESNTPSVDGSINISIQVNPEDVGRVIGKSGKVINAIRQITRIAAIQKGVRVRVDLKDDSPRQTDMDQPEVNEVVDPEQSDNDQPTENGQPVSKDVPEQPQTQEEGSEKVEPAPTIEE